MIILATVNSEFGAPVFSGNITVYGDASGGKFTAYPALRRVGIGLAAIDNDGNKIWGISLNLPGKCETVPRGELFAIFYACHKAEPDTSLEFVTDNLGCYNSYQKGRTFAVLTNNGDLYQKIFDLIDQKSLTFTIRWMPSHLKPYDVRPMGVSYLDVIGNNFADEEAGTAAKSFCIELNASSQFFHWRNLAGKIQRRLVAILQELPDKKRIRKAKRLTTERMVLHLIMNPFFRFLAMYFLRLVTLSSVPGAITRAIGNRQIFEIGLC